MPTQACVCGRTPTSALIILYSYPKSEKARIQPISIMRRVYLSKKNIIEEKGETQKNILPIKKNIVPLHTF